VSTAHVDTVALHRAQIADILAEGQRRIERGGADGPGDQRPGESNAAYALRLADFFIHLACLQAAYEAFDPEVFAMHRKQRELGSQTP
jgi:hypothetical protein